MRHPCKAWILAGLLAGCSNGDDDRRSNVQRQADQINAEVAAQQAQPGTAAADPVLEQQCKSVSREAARQLEQRMADERKTGTLTVLTGDDTTVLACSRYWAKREASP